MKNKMINVLSKDLELLKKEILIDIITDKKNNFDEVNNIDTYDSRPIPTLSNTQNTQHNYNYRPLTTLASKYNQSKLYLY